MRCWWRWTASTRQEGVIIIAATNRPDVLDPALLRPGRFDRQITVNLPDVRGREAILKVHASNVKLDPVVDLSVIARGTPGYSGAELANLLNEAALLAARTSKKAVGMAELEEARDKVRWGRERRSLAMTDEEKKLHRLARGRPRAGQCAARAHAIRSTRSPSSRAASPWARPCPCPRRTS